MAESARTKSGSAMSAPSAGRARDRTWRLRLVEAGPVSSTSGGGEEMCDAPDSIIH